MVGCLATPCTEISSYRRETGSIWTYRVRKRKLAKRVWDDGLRGSEVIVLFCTIVAKVSHCLVAIVIDIEVEFEHCAIFNFEASAPKSDRIHN
jgi:hypothetical protein